MIKKLKREDVLLLIVDIQEKMLPAMSESEDCLKNTLVLTKAFKAYKAPILFTEQYPKGLGTTEPSLLEELKEGLKFEKTKFSSLTEEVREALKKQGKKQIILTGMETHVCVYQTALDLLEEGYSVYLPFDAVTSRKKENKLNALQALRYQGALVTNTETLLFEMIGDAKDEHFRELQALIK